MSKEKDETYYFTFGGNHRDKHGNSLQYGYIKIKGTADEARNNMCNARGMSWAFMYSEEKFLPQIEEYGLHEVNINDI